jgi:hypothetical protein
VIDNASELASFSNEVALDGMDISNYLNGSLVRNGSETRALVTVGESAKKTARIFVKMRIEADSVLLEDEEDPRVISIAEEGSFITDKPLKVIRA